MEATFFDLKNNALSATFTNYGARLVSLRVPDQNGNLIDVTTGFGTIEDYLKATAPYYGATIGRFANRIANGQFELNGKQYAVPVNNGDNSLHGGDGFHNRTWEASQPDEHTLAFSYFSADGEEGFPGGLSVKVIYSLTEDAGLKIDYEASTDAPTVINLTNHAYFNLNGEGVGDILNHVIQINADQYTPVNEKLIPKGALEPVTGTPFDFREAHSIGERINDDHEQLNFGNGYDHSYVINPSADGTLSFAAQVTGDISGIVMEVYTTEPGMQFYAGNFMDGTNIFKNGQPDSFRTAFALETQHLPDSPNQPAFPSTVLNPGELFASTTSYKFSV